MAESELLCVRVATLLRNKYTSIQSDVIRQYRLSELSRFYFIFLDIGLALTTAQAKKLLWQ